MKFYSDVTRQFYDSEKECVNAESAMKAEQEKKAKAEKEKVENRKNAAEKVEAARQAAVDANKAYHDALTEFCKEYGAFHTSYQASDIEDIFNWFFNI